jgi:hypothetical protein
VGIGARRPRHHARGNLGEVGFTVAGTLVAGRPPLNPRQLLLVNLMTDAAPGLAWLSARPKA